MLVMVQGAIFRGVVRFLFGFFAGEFVVNG